jgi:OOP family OmpA-OmpF porin
MLQYIDVRRAATIAGLLCCSGAAAVADSTESAQGLERPYLGISGGNAWVDDHGDPRDGFGLKLSVGWRLGERWSAELGVSHFDFEPTAPGGADSRRTAVELEAVHAFNPSEWSPLLLVGAGAAHDDMAHDVRSSVRFTANAGLGLLSPPLNDYGVRARLEARYVYDAVANNESDVHLYLGVTLPLRKRTTAALVRREQPVREHVLREEPRHDAPIDPPEQRPGTPPEARTDPDARAVESAATFEDVHFDHDSAELTAVSIPILVRSAETLRREGAMKVEVAGHTDSVGSEAYNLSLSSRRAQRVADFLVAEGVDRSRLVAVGYGESRPVADNSAAEGRARNRRVELRRVPQ